ncbi:SseB protein N-terminal domain-containing protein [Micromonospora nigra]|uniref:SseB protein N-terminal domain-containing protein n=1 Tax=Micromonospora nigra TaxID=145857 RepID=A0A1C6RWZ8_9ACTN|nr:SseB family protein [Micromonospora nigra]SCL21593.1 SseB protein N-terminal domain-containing protein [Micromonospora nigra]
MTAWRPTTATETALLAAVEADDQETFLRELAAGPLLVPVPPEAASGQAPPAWPTGRFEGRTHVVTFTSPAAIVACLPGQPVSWRAMTLSDMALDWPGDDHLLAVDAGLPIGVRLDADDLRTLAGATVEAERDLRDAVTRQDPDALMAALLRTELVLPVRPGGGPSRDLSDPEFPWWCVPDPQGRPTLPVFTSELRLRQALGDHDAVSVSSLQLTEHWPDDSWQLLLNPDTPLSAVLPGEAVLTLREWLGELRQVLTDAAEEEQRRRVAAAYAEPAAHGVPVHRPAPAEDDDPGPDPDAPMRLQLVIPHRYLTSYLDDGYDRAAGLVHTWAGPGRDTPVRLYRRLGLLGDGSPFEESDEWVAVLRWSPGDETPEEWGRGQPRMESLVVPDGTGLHCLHRDGRDELLARFDAKQARWLPA